MIFSTYELAKCPPVPTGADAAKEIGDELKDLIDFIKKDIIEVDKLAKSDADHKCIYQEI